MLRDSWQRFIGIAAAAVMVVVATAVGSASGQSSEQLHRARMRRAWRVSLPLKLTTKIDAYHLVGELFNSREGGMDEIYGATGRLFLTADGRVHRRLAWARFERGQPVPLPDHDEFQDIFDEFGTEATYEEPVELQEAPRTN